MDLVKFERKNFFFLFDQTEGSKKWTGPRQVEVPQNGHSEEVKTVILP
jgi:hypothetical protein